MRKHRSGVLGLAGFVCMAGLAMGQTTHPQFYMWEVPPGFTQGDPQQPFVLDTSAERWTFRADMQPIVKVYLDGSRPGYEQAAARTLATITHWLDPDGDPATNDAVIDVTKLALHVRNWGSRSPCVQQGTYEQVNNRNGIADMCLMDAPRQP